MFSFEKILDFGIIAFSFVCDKYCPFINELGSKDSSRKLQINCVNSFCFLLYLVLHAYTTRFDVTVNLKSF